jgi:hypothetical protein
MMGIGGETTDSEDSTDRRNEERRDALQGDPLLS